jgi:hypothetical protein
MPRHVFEADFYIGQTVVFRLSPDDVGLVTGIQVRDGSVAYLVTWDNRQEALHYAFELRASDRPVYADAESER